MEGDRVLKANFLIDQLIFIITMDGVVGEMLQGSAYKVKMMELVKCLVLLRRVVNGDFDTKVEIKQLL